MFERYVHAVAFNGQCHLGLTVPCPARGKTGLSLPMARLGSRETYTSAAERVLRVHVPLGAVRWGHVVGHVPATAPRPGRRRIEARVLIAHLDGGHSSTGLVWMSWPEALAAARLPHVPDLDVFIEGYLQGWIPDGRITLE